MSTISFILGVVFTNVGMWGLLTYFSLEQALAIIALVFGIGFALDSFVRVRTDK